MKITLLPCILVVCASIAQADQTLNYPEKNPLVSFSVPDDWKPKVSNGSLFVVSPDGGEVIVEVMVMEASIKDDAAAVKEAKGTGEQDFKNLKFTKSDPMENNGLTATLLGGEGKDKSGEAHINMVLIKHPQAANQILFSLIASKDSAAKHGAACGAVMGSIHAVGGDKPKAKALAAGEPVTYAYPSKAKPSFTMEVPADWALEADEKGGYITSADKKFTLNIIPIDIEHIDAAMEDITKKLSAKYDEVVWNEGGDPKVHIDEATGNTLISSEGVGKGGGYDHKLGVYQFAKKGADKFFILSAWSPLKLADGPNGEAAKKKLMSVKLK